MQRIKTTRFLNDGGVERIKMLAPCFYIT